MKGSSLKFHYFFTCLPSPTTSVCDSNAEVGPIVRRLVHENMSKPDHGESASLLSIAPLEALCSTWLLRVLAIVSTDAARQRGDQEISSWTQRLPACVEVDDVQEIRVEYLNRMRTLEAWISPHGVHLGKSVCLRSAHLHIGPAEGDAQSLMLSYRRDSQA